MQNTTITNNDDVAKALQNIGKKSKDPKITSAATKYVKKNYEKKEDCKEKKKTQTDNLTKDEIKDLLEDYNKVTDINEVHIGTHLRYFTLIAGENKFRRGGNLKIINNDERYVILKNATGYEWSVQLKDTSFFKKMTMKDIKCEYDDIIMDLNSKVKKLKAENKLLSNKVLTYEQNMKPVAKKTPAKKPPAKNTKK